MKRASYGWFWEPMKLERVKDLVKIAVWRVGVRMCVRLRIAWVDGGVGSSELVSREQQNLDFAIGRAEGAATAGAGRVGVRG